MDKISVEEFKRNIKACLDQLPFEVTRRGRVLFVCYGPEGKPVETVKKQECKDMPSTTKSAVASPCEPDIGKDTIYEPDSVKPVKIKRRSVSKAVTPVVSSLLSNVKASPTVSHHPSCKCGMCLIYKRQ